MMYASSRSQVVQYLNSQSSNIGPFRGFLRRALTIILFAAILSCVLSAAAWAGVCDPQNTAFCDDFETNKGWVRNFYGDDTATAGLWSRSSPTYSNVSGLVSQPGTAISGQYSLVTDYQGGSNGDVDNGKTSITSPQIQLPDDASTVTLSFFYYFAHLQTATLSEDFSVYVKTSGGSTLVYEEEAGPFLQNATWVEQSVDISTFAGQDVRIHIEVDDQVGTIIEAGVDDLAITYELSEDSTQLFFDSFENGAWNGLWSQDGQNAWLVSTQRSTNGSHSAEVDGGASDAGLISLPIDLQGATEARIRFDWLIEYGLDYGEYLALDVSSDGGNSWTEQAALVSTVDAEDVWHSEDVTVTGLSSGPLHLRFRGTMNSSAEDANVDYVLVTVPTAMLNATPVVLNPGDQTDLVGTVISGLAIQVTDADPGDTITCTISNLPEGLQESAECVISGSITATPGDYVVTVVANDGTSNSAPIDFTWTVTAPPTPPELVSPADQVSEEGDTIYLAVQASDINGDSLVFSANGLPPGLTISTVEPTPGSFVGEITGTIQSGAAAASPYSVSVSVEAAGDIDSADFQWTVYEANLEPLVANPGLQRSHAGDFSVLPIVASDPEQWPLTFTATGLPAGLVIDETTGVITGTIGNGVLGRHSVTISVSDTVEVTDINFFWDVYRFDTATNAIFIWLNEAAGTLKLEWRYPSDNVGPTYTTPSYFEVSPGSLQQEGTVYPPDVAFSATVGNRIWQTGTLDSTDFTGSTFAIRACVAPAACSNPVLVDYVSMDAGHDLKQVLNPTVASLDNETGEFQLQWTYSQDYFNSATGKPHHFEIAPGLPQEGGATPISVPLGGSTPASGWTSSLIDDDEFVGSTYLVSACTSGGSCGLSSVITLQRTPVEPSLPVPSFTHSDITVDETLDFSLSWTANSDERINYFEIEEDGALGKLVYYTENLALAATRAKTGNYDFTVRSCHRDRDNGDTCSDPSSAVTVAIPNPPADMQPVAGLRWYWINEPSGQFGLEWQYDSNDYNATISRPDYYQIKIYNYTSQYCIPGSVDAENQDGDFTWQSPALSYACLPAGDNKWVGVKACKNSGACGSEFVLNLASAPPTSAPMSAMAPIVPISVPLPGGPDDLNPGEYWDSNRKGTGWSFYWASRLRYPSIHEQYGDTYDLIAFWFAYAQVGSDSTWRPVWLFSQMKLVGDPGNEHFQGALYYPRHTSGSAPCPNSAETCHEAVGQLVVEFRPSNRQARVYVTLSKDVGLEQVTDLQIDLTYFADDPSIDTGTVPSKIDQFSGMWAAPGDEDFALLHWLDNEHESVLIPYYDTKGVPVWVRADWGDDDGSPTNESWFDDFHVFAVPLGFNPTGTNSASHPPTVNVGTIGRAFTDYRDGEVWLNISDMSGQDGRSTALTKGSLTSHYAVQKWTSFHDVRYFLEPGDETSDECTVNDGDNCALTLNWFTDNYYPDAKVFLRNLRTNAVSSVGEGFPTVIDYPFGFAGEDDYVFELWKHNSTTINNPTGNAKIAQSKVISVVENGPAGTPETPPAPFENPDLGANSNSSQVGTTAGQFRVDESGNATYRIPILTAPGSGGVAPQVSLDYNSSAPNGVLGVGWALGGMSAITRCAQTLEQDPGALVRGVTLTEEDRFCLDGQRLVLVNGTNYGEEGAEYRTEIDRTARIVSYGQTTSGPQYFKVWSKDGSITEYGNSDDSRIEARLPGESTVLLWAQNRFEDSAGNYMLYHYDEADTGPVDFALDSITYTGNVNAQTQPYAELKFVYSTSRDDTSAQYVAGAETRLTRLLQRIDSRGKVRGTDTSMASIRSYVLTYGSSGDGYGRANLEAFQECRDSSLTYCYPPATFQWLKSEHGLSPNQSNSLPLPTPLYGVRVGDITGDGRPDLLYTYESGGIFKLKIAKATEAGGFVDLSSNGWTLPNAVPGGAGEPVAIYTIDLNADGYQDIIYPKESNGEPTWHYRLSVGDNLTAEAPLGGTLSSLSPMEVRIMDYDGDGLSDIIYTRDAVPGPGQEVAILRNTFTPSQPVAADELDDPVRLAALSLFYDASPEWELDPAVGLGLGWSRPSYDSKVFDYNGDGAVDLMVRLTRQYCRDNCGGGQVPQESPDGTSMFEIESLDGAVAAAQAQSQESTEIRKVSLWVLYISDGQGGFPERQVIGRDLSCELAVVCNQYSTVPSGGDFQPQDINADGLADLVYRDVHGDWYYQINTGVLFLPPQLIGAPPDGVNNGVQFQDINGDGYVDFLYPSATDNDFATWRLQLNDFGNGFAAPDPMNAELDPRAGNTSESDLSLFLDFTGNGKRDQFFIDLEEQSTSTHIRLGRSLVTSNSGEEPSNKIALITDGIGAETDIVYTPLTSTNTNVYSRMNDSSNAAWGNGSAVYDLIAPIYVVSSVASSAPVFGTPDAKSSIHYHYVGAKLQGGGRGFLGFGEVISFDPQSDIRTNTRYRQDFPFVGLPADTTQVQVTAGGAELAPISDLGQVSPLGWSGVSETTVPPDVSSSGDLLSYVINEWATKSTAGSARFPYISHSLERSYTLQGNFSSKILVDNDYDNLYGNLLSNVVRTYDTDDSSPIATQTTVNSYNNSVSSDRWWLGRLAATTVTHARPGKPSVTRKSAFAYDADTGILNQEVVEPNNNPLKVTTNYVLDDFGNRESVSVVGKFMTARNTTTEFDTLGRFAVRTENAYGQTTSLVVDWDVFGTPLEMQDINGVTTQTAVDHMGRPFGSYTQTGAWAKTLHGFGPGAYCQDDDEVATVFHTVTTGGGQPDQYQCFDVLGREIRTATEGFVPGQIYHVDRYYDESGRPEQVTEPYSGGAIYYNLTEYDSLGRILMVTRADSNHQTYHYDEAASDCLPASGARRMKVTNGNSQFHIEVRNALGEIVAAYDDKCEKVEYDYDAVGNLVSVTGVDGAEVVTHYDLAGRKDWMDDPDKGYWTYEHNALGELVEQTDAKGQTIEFEYDLLGRVITRWEYNAQGSLVNREETHWNNSTTSNPGAPDYVGKGEVESEVYYDGNTANVVHQRSYGYDGLGRIISASTSMDGLLLTEETTYDEYGRVFQQFDASGDNHGLRYVYNDRGYLETLKEAREGTAGKEYQKILSMDARGNVTQMLLGSGVDVAALYDPAGGRIDSLTAAKGAVVLQDVRYSFDVLGNLLSREDLSQAGSAFKESFSYDDDLNRLEQVMLEANGNPAQTTLTLSYDAAGNIRCKSDVGGIPDPEDCLETANTNYTYGSNAGPHAVTQAGGVSYTYDLNGNQESSSDGRNISYSVFDKPTLIAKSGAQTAFAYGIGNRRIKRTDLTGGSKTTWYFGSVERIEVDGGSAYFKRYLGGVAIADYYPSSSQSNAQNIQYLIKDHLGSIHTVTDHNGQVLERMHFGAFGERQDVQDWVSPINSAASAVLNSYTTRGFTGHEHVDDLDVIHMNGRIYDPRLGRFLQADPIVQDLTYSQSLNRYSYGFNSLLSGTDPSGYWFEVFIAKVVFSTFINFIYSKVTESDAQPPDDAWKSQLPGNIIPGVVSGVFGASTSTSSVRTCIQGTSVCGGAPWQRSPGSHRQQVAAETMGDTYSDGTAGKFANGAATISYEFTVGYVQREADPASLATSAAEVLVPGYDLYQCTQTRDCSGVVIAIGIVGIVPAGKLASIAGKGIVGIARAAVKWQKAKRKTSISLTNATPVGRRAKNMSEADSSPHTPQHVNPPYQPVQNRPGSVYGTDYTGHALDQMRNRGLVPSVIENALRTGTRSPGNLPGTTVITDSTNRVRVIVNSAGRVITVE